LGYHDLQSSTSLSATVMELNYPYLHPESMKSQELDMFSL